MNRINPLAAAIAVAIALLVGSCASDGAGDQTTTSRAEESTTSTSTTTTLPPGLTSQSLAYGFLPEGTWAYDTHHDFTFEVVPLDDGSAEAFGFTDSVTMHLTTSGRQRTLVLDGPTAESVEIVQDFLADEGSFTLTMGDTEIKQVLQDVDLAELDVTALPTLVNGSGLPVEGLAGTPAYFHAPGRLIDVLTSYGPVFDIEAVDVGDSWTFEHEDLIAGPLFFQATVTDEVELDEGQYVFAIDYSAAATTVPLSRSLAEAAGLATGPDLLGVGDVLDLVGLDGEITVNEMSVFGDALFDPLAGVVTKLEVTQVIDFEMDLTAEGESASFGYVMTLDSRMDLDKAREGNSFLTSAVLDQFEFNPYDLAAEALFGPLFFYEVEEADADVTDSVFAKLDEISPDIDAGLSLARFTDEKGSAADVFALTNGGDFRGYPALAEALAEFWSGSEPTAVTVAGREAFRSRIDGNEWLMWNNDTHTFIVVGSRATAGSFMADIMDLSDPYLWQPGDCLDFREFDNVAPYSPFGLYGLTHCRQPHSFEVLYSEWLPEGPDDPYPDDMADRVTHTCGQRFFEHTGSFPLDTSLDMVMYLPDRREWDRNARYVACVIYLEEADGPATVKARLQGAGRENPIQLAAGTCLSGSLPVPCQDPHSSEIIAVENYESAADAEYPDMVALRDELVEACEAVFADAPLTEGDLELESGMISDITVGWENGVRTYYCLAAALDADEINTMVTGTFTGEWEEAPEQVDA